MIDGSMILEQLPLLCIQKFIEGILIFARMLLSAPTVFMVAVVAVLVMLNRHYR